MKIYDALPARHVKYEVRFVGHDGAAIQETVIMPTGEVKQLPKIRCADHWPQAKKDKLEELEYDAVIPLPYRYLFYVNETTSNDDERKEN